MKTYSINEIFYSLQGEGYYTGRPAVFIRFAGCNLRCPFCDTDFSKGRAMTAAEIVKAVHVLHINPRPFIVLTGGEPTLQVDGELISALHELSATIAMETNGTRPVPDGIDFVTCSPKCDFMNDYPVIPRANEVKVVYDGEHLPDKWIERIVADHYYLQPCDTGDPEKNRAIQQEAVAYCLQHPRWRLSLQTQKILNVR